MNYEVKISASGRSHRRIKNEVTEFDAASSWVANYDYAAENELFTFTPTQLTAKGFGETENLVQGQEYFGKYETPQTSGTSLTIAEIAKIRIVNKPGSNAEEIKSYHQDNTGGNIPATLVDPTVVAAPKEGEVVTQEYDDGLVFSFYQGGTWNNVANKSAGLLSQLQDVDDAAKAEFFTTVVDNAGNHVYKDDRTGRTFYGTQAEYDALAADIKARYQYHVDLTDLIGLNSSGRTVSDTAPTTPNEADVWWDNTDNTNWIRNEFMDGAWQDTNDRYDATTDTYTNAGSGAVAVTENYQFPTADYQILTTDKYIQYATGGFTVTLPTAVGNQKYTPIIINASSGNITIDTLSSQTINGVLTKIVPSRESATLVSDGSNYNII